MVEVQEYWKTKLN
jgi:hypothetical protein